MQFRKAYQEPLFSGGSVESQLKRHLGQGGAYCQVTSLKKKTWVIVSGKPPLTTVIENNIIIRAERDLSISLIL